MARRKYVHSTPLGRLARNVDKLSLHGGLVEGRLRAWDPGSDSLVAAALGEVERILEGTRNLSHYVEALSSKGYVPPERQSSPSFESGQKVEVREHYRKRYEVEHEDALRDCPDMLDDLVVDRVLATGKIAVRCGRRAPIVASKSHLRRVSGA